MTNSSEDSVGTAPILGAAERELLLETWNSTDQPYPDNTCLHQLFEDQVELSPEAIAIVHGERTITYGELNAYANQIARQLLDAGVKPGDYVMLLLDRSIDLVASEIAVLKTGAAYVPIDTNAPIDRQAYIASDCRSTVIITDNCRDIPTEFQSKTVLRVGALQMHSVDVQDHFERPMKSSFDPAYV
ncbi:hypothetical protein BGZ70_006177, partial [Mortierella alpina]